MVVRSLALICLTACFLSACAFSQAPPERNAVFSPYQVTGVAPKSNLGTLMLDETGLWSFVHRPSSEKPPELEQGQLVAFLPAKSHVPAHLFGVVLTRSWGAMLQRLDSNRVSPGKVAGELVALTNDAQVGSWGLCRGGGEAVAQNACLTKRRRVTAWRIFEFGSDLRLRVADEWGLAAPIRTDGLVQGRRATLRKDAARTGWIAVPARATTSRIPHARALLGPGCADIDLSQSLQPLEVFTGRPTSAPSAETVVGGGHPVDVEASAIATGTDVLVECSKSAVTVAAPSIFRPLLFSDGTSARAMPFGMMRPLVIARESNPPGALRLASAVALMSAALSTGSPLAADFYLEQALLAAGDTEIGRRLAVEFMQVPSAAGRPEVALYSGREATKDAWQRQSMPGFVIGSAWALAALGQEKAHGEAIARVATLGEPGENERVKLWLIWSQLRDGLRTSSRKADDNAISHFDEQGLTKWLEAAQVLASWRESGARPLSDSTSGIHLAFEPSKLDCGDRQTCKLDVYGRNFAAFLENIGADRVGVGKAGVDRNGVDKNDGDKTGAEKAQHLLEEFNTLGLSALRPGFVLSALDTSRLSPEMGVSLRAATMALVAPAARAEGFEALVDEVARLWRARGACAEIDDREFIAWRVASLARRQSKDATLAATYWLLGSALPSACDSLETFMASLEVGIEQYPKLAAQAGVLFEALADGANDEERASILRRYADFSAEHEKGSACKRWNLALAVSSAMSTRLSEAERHLGRAINCEAQGEGAYSDSEALLIGYLQFEKSASLPDGLPEGVREQLSALIRRRPEKTHRSGKQDESDTCLGLASLEYELARFVHPDIAALAVGLPAPPRDALALETSSYSTSRAIASLVVARRLLGEGRPEEAAKALTDSRQSFERVGHQVGLRRVAFLEAVVFDRDLDAFVSSEDRAAPSNVSTKKASTKKASTKKVSMERAETLSAAQWAQALRAGQSRAVLDVVQERGLDTPQALEAALAASLIVDSEEHSRELWRSGSGRTSFNALCAVEK